MRNKDILDFRFYILDWGARNLKSKIQNLKFIPILTILLSTLFFMGCEKKEAMYTYRWTAMGTTAELKIVTSKDPDKAAALAKRVVAEIESELSAFSAESIVGRLNATAGNGEWFEFPYRTYWVFVLSEGAVNISGGAFDPTVGPLMELWGFRGKQKLDRIPTDEEIQDTLQRVGWDKVDIDIKSSQSRVRLTQEGMRLDFGAIAKGYAVDAVYSTLMDEGYTNILVNIGGDMRGNGRKWKIGIRDPKLPLGEGILGTIILTDGLATTTSGSYERFVEIDGKRYSHIIDARTGYLVEGVEQVTVIAITAVDADALSTVLFILGREKGMELLEQWQGVEAMFVEDGTMYFTPGFRVEK